MPSLSSSPVPTAIGLRTAGTEADAAEQRARLADDGRLRACQQGADADRMGRSVLTDRDRIRRGDRSTMATVKSSASHHLPTATSRRDRWFTLRPEPPQTEIQRVPSLKTSTPVPAPAASLGLRPLLAKAMAPAPGDAGSVGDRVGRQHRRRGKARIDRVGPEDFMPARAPDRKRRGSDRSGRSVMGPLSTCRFLSSRWLHLRPNRARRR